MRSRFYMGNIAPNASEDGLREALLARGLHVAHVSLVLNRATGENRGFAFVEFEGSHDAEEAMAALEGASIDGRLLVLRPVEERTTHRG